MFTEIGLKLSRTAETFLQMIGAEIVFATILFSVISIVLWLFKKSSPGLQLGLWTLFLFRLALPPTLSSPISAREVFESFQSQNAPVFAAPSNELQREQVKMRNERSLLPAESEFRQVPTISQNNLSAKFQWQTLLFLLWCGGSLFVLALFAQRAAKFRKLVKSARRLDDNWILEIVGIWRKRLKIRRKVRIVCSDAYLSPFTISVFRPTIFLPKALVERRHEKSLRMIVAHEMAHIKRFDAVWLKLQAVLQAVYFFYPLLWFANRKINQAREKICDGMVLQYDEFTPAEYGASMLQILKMNMGGTRNAAFVAGFGGSKNLFEQRLREIMTTKNLHRNRSKLHLAVCIAVGIFLLPMAKNPENGGLLASALFNKKATAESKKPHAAPQFQAPIKTGKVTATFGAMKDPFTQREAFHRGVDVATSKGTPVYAAADGKIDSAITEYKINKGYGRYVIISHDQAFKTKYAHLNAVEVEAGQTVKAGEMIGRVGNTGRSTGNHLHFELLKNNKPVDPAKNVNFSHLPGRVGAHNKARGGFQASTQNLLFEAGHWAWSYSPNRKVQSGDSEIDALIAEKQRLFKQYFPNEKRTPQRDEWAKHGEEIYRQMLKLWEVAQRKADGAEKRLALEESFLISYSSLTDAQKSDYRTRLESVSYDETHFPAVLPFYQVFDLERDFATKFALKKAIKYSELTRNQGYALYFYGYWLYNLVAVEHAVVFELIDGYRLEGVRTLEKALKYDLTAAQKQNAKHFISRLKPNLLGAKAADFSTQSITGEHVSLSDFEGKIVLMHIWIPWLTHSEEMIAELKDIRNRIGADKIELVSIALGGAPELLRSRADELRMDWPQIHDPKGLLGGKLPGWHYDVLGASIPSGSESGDIVVIIDQKGNVVGKAREAYPLRMNTVKHLPRPQ